MSELSDAIVEYKQSVEDVPVTKSADADVKVLKALLARDSIARELSIVEPPPEMLAAIADVDHALKAKAEKINEIVGSAKLVEWREARQQPATLTPSQAQGDVWWWSLDTRAAGDGWHKHVLTYLLWVCIVVSLSFIVESLRRFLSGEVGILGTVLQGLVTLLVGGTLVELARQVAALRAGRTDEKKKSPPLKGRLIFTGSIVVIAFIMWFLLPQVVKYYSNRGVSERYEGQLSNPISNYQLTISLDPTDAIAHYNLARAYEAVAEYEKAEAEYKAAIRWGDELAVAYNGLAHIMMAQKKDYAGSLRLLDIGLDKIEKQKEGNFFQSEDDYKRVKVSLLRNRAWAYFGLKYFIQAKDELQEAIKLRPDAAAHCMLGQVLEEESQKPDNKSTNPEFSQEAQQAYIDCISLSHEQKDRIEADWMAHAQERLNQEDEKESADTVKDRTPGRQIKKR